MSEDCAQWGIIKDGHLGIELWPSYQRLSLFNIMTVIALGSSLEDSGPMGDLTYCAQNPVVDASLNPESSVNCLPGGRISDDGPGEKAYEGALTAFSGSLVAGTSNTRCLLLMAKHRHTSKATGATIPTMIPAITPLDSPDECANGWTIAVGEAGMNILVDANPVCPVVELVKTVVLGIGLVVVLVTVV
jgi:hypothetical protein